MVGPSIGPYRILERLGAGGMGEVYLAEDPRLKRQVAIKTVAEKLLGEPDARRRLLREARAAANLSHPNIAAIYDILESDGRAHIVMEYVRGETLAAAVKRGPLGPARALEIGLQLADALEAAHALGIVHRDLKPHNVVLTPDAKAKVLDFGLAKRSATDDAEASSSAEFTSDGFQIVGTPQYMSPEQLKGKPVDARSDLYSFGVVLFEMLTGQRPYEGRDPQILLTAILSESPPSARALNPGVPAELDAIASRAMAREPTDRYSSATTLRADLARAAASLDEISTLSKAARIPSRVFPAWSRGRLALAVLPVLALAAGLRWLPTLARPSTRVPADAARWYEHGTAALREGSYLTAAKRLEQAVALHDAYPVAHARLAEARAELDDDRAKDSLLYVQKLVPDLSRLPKDDALALEGIRAMVTRRFGDAIRAYAELAGRFPSESYVQFDLGRAHEANDEHAKAIACYEKAAQLDSSSPAPHLRLGVLHGKQQQLQLALSAFERAEALYEAASGVEGITEVSYQRGVLYDKLDRSTEAREYLSRALDLALKTGNAYQQVRILLRTGSVAATQGNFTEAERLATQAVSLARDMPELMATALTDLANVHFARGDYAEAERHFQDALATARRQRNRAAEARALLSLGSLRISQNAIAEGVRLVNEALPYYQRGGYRKESAQAFTLLAAGYEAEGQYDKAIASLESQLRVAVEMSDSSLAASTHDILADTLLACERYPDALRHAEASIETHRKEGNRLSLTFALINRTLAFAFLGRDAEAQTALADLRQSVAEDRAARHLRARVERVAGYVAAAGGRFTEAERSLRRAIQEPPPNDDAFIVEANIELGRVSLRAGRLQQGLALSAAALEGASRLGDRTLEAAALLCRAEALLVASRAEEALAAAERAALVFESSKLDLSSIHARLLATGAAQRLGKSEAAASYEREANRLILELRNTWGADVARKLLERPDLRPLLPGEKGPTTTS